MNVKLATEVQLSEFLGVNPDWKLIENKLQNTYVFNDFIQAFGFMTQAAIIAEKQNHHPEWFNVYKTVRVDLSTHEAGGITEKDFLLAKAMDKIAKQI